MALSARIAHGDDLSARMDAVGEQCVQVGRAACEAGRDRRVDVVEREYQPFAGSHSLVDDGLGGREGVPLRTDPRYCPDTVRHGRRPGLDRHGGSDGAARGEELAGSGND